MIKGVGIDILAVSRMERLLSHETFCARIFTVDERAHIAGAGLRAAQTAAGVFCAKEAYAKAMGCGLSGPLFQQVRLRWDSVGRPTLVSDMPGSKELLFHVSITHDNGMASALVICEARP